MASRGFMTGGARKQENLKVRRTPRDTWREWQMMKEEDLMTSWDIPGAVWGKPEDFSKVSGKNLKVGVAERNSNIQR